MGKNVKRNNYRIDTENNSKHQLEHTFDKSLALQ